jgi:hypothetical protein
LETVEIPIPPLAEQTAIVARWRKAQDEIAAARERVEKRKATIDARFFADLGLRSPTRRRYAESLRSLVGELSPLGCSLQFS